MWSSTRSLSIASAPTRADSTSEVPPARSAASISSTARSAAPSGTGRRVSALRSPAASFSRSNSWRTPSRLITTSLAASIRSYVVKRAPQAKHSRRRRIVAASSRSRESTTRESRDSHCGQCISHSSAPDHYILWCRVTIPQHSGTSGPCATTAAAAADGDDREDAVRSRTTQAAQTARTASRSFLSSIRRSAAEPARRVPGGARRAQVGGDLDDRFPGVEDVEVAALDRGLALGPASPADAGSRERRASVVDHVERACRATQLLAEPLAQLLVPGRRHQCLRLDAVALHRVTRRVERLDDRVGRHLPATHGIDPLRCAGQTRRDPGCQVARRLAETVQLPGLGDDACGTPQHQQERDGEEREEEQRDGEEDRLRHRRSPYPARARRADASAGTTAARSATTNRSANSPIGASGSRFTATMISDVCMPTLCWMAPETPNAR